MPDSNKRALANHRRQLAEQGLVRVESIVPKNDAERLRAAGRLLRQGGPAAESLRRALDRTGDGRPGDIDIFTQLAVDDDLDLTPDLPPRDYPRDVDL